MKMDTIQPHHDAGFFSVCNIDLQHVENYYRNHKKFAFLDTSLQWKWYRDSENDSNLYNFFFEFIDKEFKIPVNDCEYWFDYKDEDQFSDYSKIKYEYIAPFIKKYFSFSQNVIDFQKYIVEKYKIKYNNLITICYRGTDKCRETNLPTYQQMELKLIEIYERNPDMKILVQSEDLDFCNYICGRIKNTFTIEEVMKINGAPWGNISLSIPYGSKIKNAKMFLAVVGIMSKSKILITNSGNVGLWICYFRGNFNGVHQFLNKKNENIDYWFE